MNKFKKNSMIFLVVAFVLLLLFVLNWFGVMYYLISALIGLLLMIKIQDTDAYTFKYLMALLLLINLIIFAEFFLWSLDFTSYLVFFIIPFALSYVTGQAYLLLKLYYPDKIK